MLLTISSGSSSLTVSEIIHKTIIALSQLFEPLIQVWALGPQLFPCAGLLLQPSHQALTLTLRP